MQTSKGDLSIADPSQPNAGRVYDFLLGGHHNFEVDRKVATELLGLAPFMPKVLRLIRWFLGEATRRLVDKGFDRFLDFASGLPTADHIHQLAPPGTRVIYSDKDPVVVEYAREILGDHPFVRFVLCDAARPEDLLGFEVVGELFGKTRKVAIGFNGIAYFLSDQELQHAMQVLYDWAEVGSMLSLCDGDADASERTEALEAVFDLYDRIGQRIYTRSRTRMMELVRPWRVDEPGCLALHEWVGLGKEVTDQEVTDWGGRGFYGALLRK